MTTESDGLSKDEVAPNHNFADSCENVLEDDEEDDTATIK